MRERLRELVGRWHKQADDLKHTTGYHGGYAVAEGDGIERCADELDALLAAEADDDEPVSVDWMDETLGTAWLGVIHDRANVTFSVMDGQFVPYIWAYEVSCNLPPVHTRGEVRRLLHVLGVEVGNANQETNG